MARVYTGAASRKACGDGVTLRRKPSKTSRRDGLRVPCEDGHGEILDLQAGWTAFEVEGRGALVGFDQHEELLCREGDCAFGEDWHFKPCHLASEFHEYPCGTSREDQNIFLLRSCYLGVFQERFDFRECNGEFHVWDFGSVVRFNQGARQGTSMSRRHVDHVRFFLLNSDQCDQFLGQGVVVASDVFLVDLSAQRFVEVIFPSFAVERVRGRGSGTRE